MIPIDMTGGLSTTSFGGGNYATFGVQLDSQYIYGFTTYSPNMYQFTAPTFNLKPDKDYLLAIDYHNISVAGLTFDAPRGYTVYLNDERRSCINWYTGTIPSTLKIRVQNETTAAFGVASPLRPGRIVWTVGVGSLDNGKPAGAISLRRLDLQAEAFTPAALDYDNASPQVERIVWPTTGIRQIYATNGLVDVTADNDHAFRIKFFPRTTGQIGEKGQDGTYAVTGDPLYEYLIENPVDPTLEKKIRITRLVRQGGATLEMWTEMEKITASGNPYSVVDWVEKASGATAVVGPVQKITTYPGSSEITYTGDGTNSQFPQSYSTTAVMLESRTYTGYSWGGELTETNAGSWPDHFDNKTFSYANRKVVQSASTGLGPTYYAYYTDIQSPRGQVAGVYKPFATTSANPSNPAVGEVTTYAYVSDWTGRPILPHYIATTVNNVVTAKAEINYTTENVVDTSQNYTSTPNATMPLVVATRTDFYDGSHYLTTVTKSFRADCDPEHRFFPGLPHSVKKPDGTMTVALYFRGTFSTSARTFTASKGGAEVLTLNLNGTTTSSGDSVLLQSYQLAQPLAAATGDQTQATESDFRIVPGMSTAEAVVRSADGTIISTASLICTGTTSSLAWQIIRRDVHFYDSEFYLEHTSRDSGNTSVTWDIVTNSWTKGRLNYSVDESGIRTDFTYDVANRMHTKVRQGGTSGNATVPALTTTLDYDAAGHVVTETVSGVGTSETLVTIRVFDIAGRLTSETTAGYATSGSNTASAVATSYAYSPGYAQWSKTTTLPTGSTRIESKNPDGRLGSVTGTGVVAEYYTYNVESSGSFYTRVNLAASTSVRKRETWLDMVGRPAKTRVPGFNGQADREEVNVFDDFTGSNTGRLIKTTRTGYAPTLYQYDSLSRPMRTGLDVDSGGTLVLASGDRISDTSNVFESYDGAWWLTKTDSNYPFTGGSAATATQVSKSRKRLTGLTSTLRAETRTSDAEGNETRIATTVDASNKLATVTATRPGMATNQIEKALNGLPIESTNHDGLTYKKRYDGLARLVGEIDPRTGTETNPSVKTIYHLNTTWPKEVTDTADKRLSLTDYDGAGRVVCTKDAANATTRTLYTARSEVDKVWGTATYPVSYVYSEYGERTKLRTYQDSNSASATDTTSFPSVGAYNETTWEFDSPTGLLKKKTDAKGKFVEYLYNVRGQIYMRFWSRTYGGNRVAATYSYDSSTGENTGVSYNDGTPSVSYTYTRSGQTDSAVDVAGTRDFVYDSSKPWRLATEALDTFYGSRALTHTYESSTSTDTGDSSYTGHTIGSVFGRTKGLQVGTTSTPANDLEFIYASSNAGRIAGLVSKRANGSASRQFVYGYETSAPLVKTLSVVSNAFFVTRDFEGTRDLVTNVETKWNGTTRTKFAYTYDDLRRRQSVVQSGDVFADYGDSIHQIFTYNGRSELTAAATFLGPTATDQSTSLSARKHEFDYDGIGNRKWSNTSGLSAIRDHYTVNELNQYTNRENNTLAVGGVADSDAQVAVRLDGVAGRAGKHWGDNITLENSVGPFYGPLRIYAVKSGNPYSRQVLERTAFLAPFNQTSSNDDDGNITDDGVWTYEWDAENRLRAMQATANAVAAGMPNQRLELKYDYLNRRVQKTILSWSGTAWTVSSARRYLYDGWSLIGEFDAPSGTSIGSLVRSYTWGLDIARSLTDAGGVGALLQIRDYGLSKDYFPAYDGNGNIAALFDSADGGVAAAYEYSPYGELLRCEGTYAKENSFRFSTKFTDDETGLVYYGQRYYSPSQGRFVCRDPKEEMGGRHLYAMVHNNPINRWDVLGMYDGFLACGWSTQGMTNAFNAPQINTIAIASLQMAFDAANSTVQQGAKPVSPGSFNNSVGPAPSVFLSPGVVMPAPLAAPSTGTTITINGYGTLTVNGYQTILAPAEEGAPNGVTRTTLSMTFAPTNGQSAANFDWIQWITVDPKALQVDPNKITPLLDSYVTRSPQQVIPSGYFTENFSNGTYRDGTGGTPGTPVRSNGNLNFVDLPENPAGLPVSFSTFLIDKDTGTVLQQINWSLPANPPPGPPP